MPAAASLCSANEGKAARITVTLGVPPVATTLTASLRSAPYYSAAAPPLPGPCATNSFPALAAFSVTSLASFGYFTCLNFGIFHGPKKNSEIKLHTIYSGIPGHIKPFKLVGWAAEFKFQSKFEPLLLVWPTLSKAIPG